MNRWRKQRKPNASAPPPLDAADALVEQIEYYTAVHDEAMNAWQESRKDKQVRFVEQTTTGGDDAKKKESVRTENRSGNPALLAKAMEARKMIDDLQQQLVAIERAEAAANGDFDLESLTDEDLENMSDAQLEALDIRLSAAAEPPIEPLTKEELRTMGNEQLVALAAQLVAQISLLPPGDGPAVRASQGMAGGNP